MLPQDIGRPVHVPQGVGDLPRLVQASVGTFQPSVLALLRTFLTSPSTAALMRLEEALVGQFLGMAGQVVAGMVACLHRDARWVEGSVAHARAQSSVPLRHHGQRTTPVRFLGGLRLLLDVPYLSEDRSARPGRRRGRGRRGPAGGGLYPTLRALGIRDQATPALASEVAKQATRTASFEEARQALAERGVAMDEKSVWGLTCKVGQEALRQRDARIETARAGIVLSREFAGSRLYEMCEARGYVDHSA